jgi:hypothetical protein
MAKKLSRTFTAQFILKGDDGGERRVQRGERVELTSAQFERAAAAEAVHRDEDRDAEVEVRQPATEEEVQATGRRKTRDGRARSVRPARTAARSSAAPAAAQNDADGTSAAGETSEADLKKGRVAGAGGGKNKSRRPAASRK